MKQLRYNPTIIVGGIADANLSSEGKQRRYTSVIPYSINIETARSTYRNGILEITFNRK